ncbi:hypothetical protein [Cyanobacterium aponinum]|nr:hypothetical protein [Cyanobacterium aponinum]
MNNPNRPTNKPYQPTGKEIISKRDERRKTTGVTPSISMVVNQLRQANNG